MSKFPTFTSFNSKKILSQEQLLSNKKSSVLQSISSTVKFNTDQDILKNEEFDELDFKKKKKTIHIFLKKNDLKMINLGFPEIKKNTNLLQKNVSLEFINLSKKLFQNNLAVKKEKGSLLVNELWSHDYYKKVVKFSHLKNIMDHILKTRRSKYIENKKKFLDNIKSFDDFHKEMDNFDPLNPFRIKREKSGINRRTGVTFVY